MLFAAPVSSSFPEGTRLFVPICRGAVALVYSLRMSARAALTLFRSFLLCASRPEAPVGRVDYLR